MTLDDARALLHDCINVAGFDSMLVGYLRLQYGLSWRDADEAVRAAIRTGDPARLVLASEKPPLWS